MRSTLILMFFLSSIFSQNILFLEYFGGDSLYVKSITESPIAGFQFELDNLGITNVNMPNSISGGFNISYNSNTVTGFSLTGATIPSGTNILSVVYFDILSSNEKVCFYNECFQNTSNNGGTFYNCSLSNIGGAYLPIENYTTGLDYCVEGCFEETACNYLTTDSCEYPEMNFDCFGNCIFETDECGVCGGDNSTCTDCAGIPNGTALVDECGVCGGDDSSCTDCAGVPNGTNWDSNCGCVVDGNSGDDCDDCFGIPNGTALVDECGVCGGDDSACTDCNDEINGDASIDGCGVCVGGNTGEVACSQDCLGIDGGSAYYDACDACVDLGDTSCVEGCDGNYANDESHLVDDECGVCDGDDSSCTDCAGVPNGTNWDSNCGCVVDGNSGDDCDDCFGIPNGTALDDECGVCGGDDSSCADCAGVANGDSFINNCSECVVAGDTSCVEGCDGNFVNDGSHAVDDECGVCSGNNLSCVGCDGILNSGIVEDACGNCGGDCILDPFIDKIVCTSQSNNQYNQIIANCLGECGGDECLSIEENIPYSVSITSIYPNPFNPSINIEYSVASVGHVILQIIGLDGRHINTITNSVQTQGLYNVQWTPNNVPSGMYLIQLEANSQIQNKKIVYLK
jgi:hypothetical protein